MKGQYIHTTHINPDKKEALITTNFYLDGDALNVLYLKHGELMIEDYLDKLEDHKSSLKKKIETMEVFSEHVKWLSTIFTTLLSFVIQTGNDLLQFGLAGVFGLLGYFFSKYIFTFLIWVTRFVVKIYSRRFGLG